MIAGRAIDENHLLRVVYEIKDDRLIIVTFYPARSDRYEDRV